MTHPSGPSSPWVTPLTAHDPRTIGPYRVLSRLGVGGQGVVYLGQDGPGRQAAVKTISVTVRHHHRARERFVQEIEAARRVAPFCTAQILLADVDGEVPFVASEFIDGPTLERLVQQDGVLHGNALHRLAVGTAAALATIHRAGVVHRDVKPSNVILGPDGPRVIDFGIARALEATGTLTSQVIGTPAYMAPERFRGADVGQPCDVFSWAATIAFAAGGRSPFGGGPMVAVMHRVLHDPPDLANLSGPLGALVEDCLSKNPDARPDAQQVLLRLLEHPAQAGAADLPDSVVREAIDVATAGETVRVATPTPAGETVRVAAPTPAGRLRHIRRRAGDPRGLVVATVSGVAGGYASALGPIPATLVGAAVFLGVYAVRLLVAVRLDPPAPAGVTGDPSPGSPPTERTAPR